MIIISFLLIFCFQILVMPTCNLSDDCIAEEMFLVRWLAPNFADIRVPESFERQGIFKCVTTEVRDGSTCSWPPLGKIDLLSRLPILFNSSLYISHSRICSHTNSLSIYIYVHRNDTEGPALESFICVSILYFSHLK